MSVQGILLIGTRAHHGVAGCMADELLAQGEQVHFLEVHLGWRRNLASRAVERLFSPMSARVRSVNVQARQRIGHDDIRSALVTNGRELRPATVREIRETLEARGGGVACYLCDDPFNPAHRTKDWLRSLPEYSVVVSTKRRVMPDLVALGCRSVRYARFGYHPAIHRTVAPDAHGFAAMDIAFAGNADTDRLPILAALAEGAEGLQMGLFGSGWESRDVLRRIAQPAVVGLRYSAAMCAATVCPCLIRRANRDGHVMRSIELPAIGAFMLAERTDEHQEIFEEGVHCEYWGSTEELVAKARWYSQHPAAARAIAIRGHELITAGGFTYAERARQVLGMIPR